MLYRAQRPTATAKRTTDGARTPSASEAAASSKDPHSPAKPVHACVHAREGGGGYEFAREGAGRKVCRDADRCGHRRELELHGTHPRAHMTTPAHGRLPFAASWSGAAAPRRPAGRTRGGCGRVSVRRAQNRTWHDPEDGRARDTDAGHATCGGERDTWHGARRSANAEAGSHAPGSPAWRAEDACSARVTLTERTPGTHTLSNVHQRAEQPARRFGRALELRGRLRAYARHRKGKEGARGQQLLGLLKSGADNTSTE
jgi:hypothetical protein